jgi:hypothetical protein
LAIKKAEALKLVCAFFYNESALMEILDESLAPRRCSAFVQKTLGLLSGMRGNCRKSTGITVV